MNGFGIFSDLSVRLTLVERDYSSMDCEELSDIPYAIYKGSIPIATSISHISEGSI